MTDSPKLKRPYRSNRRQAQARETRRQIVEAARRQFTENGYMGATIEAIAQEADVAPETIYAIYGNKRTLLASVIEVAVGGDDQPVAVLQRSGAQAVLQLSDPVQQLQMFAEDIAKILERVAPLFGVMRAAARTEPEIADLLHALLAERFQNLSRFVGHVAARTALRSAIDETTASETVWAMTSPEIFSLFTADRGWTRAQYARWLGDALVRWLLP